MSREAQDVLLRQLKNPFDPKFIKWRVGATDKAKTKGIALAYLDAREAMKRLDEVCGLGGWQDRYKPVDGGFICEIDILIGDVWVTKSNAAGYTQVEAIKGGASDAFKRAASTWGIGRYLYYLPKVWVPIKPQGKSYVLSEIPELPNWAKPGQVERWEDIAELEAAAETSVGADETSNDIPSAADEIVVSMIRDAKSKPELQSVIGRLSAGELKDYFDVIQVKKKELSNVTA